MRYRYWLALIGLLIFDQVLANENVATHIYLIRHAEKEQIASADPALTAQGIQRAHHWATFFQDVDLAGVYSTDTRRTRDTAAIIAKAKALTLTIYDTAQINATQFIDDNLGKSVLVVGHSNTIPAFANTLLGDSRFGELDESIYSALYMVDIAGEERLGKKLHIALQPISHKLSLETSPMPQHEKINYLEFMSNDLAASKAFFSKAFGWKFTDYGPDYTAFADEGVDGGIYSGADPVATSENGGVLTVFYSDDLETTLTKVEEAGGKIIKPIFSFPGGRRFQFLEPGGNELAVWGLDSEQPE